MWKVVKKIKRYLKIKRLEHLQRQVVIMASELINSGFCDEIEMNNDGIKFTGRSRSSKFEGME